MIYVIATLTVRPEFKGILLAAAKACIEATRQEEGCLAYDLHESTSDPSKIVFVERWESADHLAPHGKSEHMKALGRVAVKCLSSPAVIEIITPAKVDRR